MRRQSPRVDRAKSAASHRDIHADETRRRQRATERVEAHLKVAGKTTERPRAEDFLFDDFFRRHDGRRGASRCVARRRRRRGKKGSVRSAILDDAARIDDYTNAI
jgi:uncharacterized protein YdaU (DUF1376 family)